MAKKKAKESGDKDEKDPRAPVARDGAYVMMLFATLVAIVAGCVFMYLDFDEYGQKSAPDVKAPNISKLGDKAPPDPTPAKAAPAPDPAVVPPAGMPMGGMPMGGMPMGMMP